MQRDYMLHSTPEGQAFEVRYMAAFHDDDFSCMESNRDTVTGRAMSQWWDECGEAGPKSRPASQFSEQPPSLDVLALVNNSELVNFGVISFGAPKKISTVHLDS